MRRLSVLAMCAAMASLAVLTARAPVAQAEICVTMTGVAYGTSTRRACATAQYSVRKQVRRLQEKTGNPTWRITEWIGGVVTRRDGNWVCRQRARVCTPRSGL